MHSFPENWPLLLAGDLNGQLGTNITGVTDKYTVKPGRSHKKNGKSLGRALRDCALCAVSTMFQPEWKKTRALQHCSVHTDLDAGGTTARNKKERKGRTRGSKDRQNRG